MQPEKAYLADTQPDGRDVAAYVSALSAQLAQICVMAGMDKAARLLEEAAEAARE